MGITGDCLPAVTRAPSHIPSLGLSPSQMILINDGSSRTHHPQVPLCLRLCSSARQVTCREWEILPVNLVPEPLLPAKPEQPHGRLGKEAGKEG